MYRLPGFRVRVILSSIIRLLSVISVPVIVTLDLRAWTQSYSITKILCQSHAKHTYWQIRCPAHESVPSSSVTSYHFQWDCTGIVADLSPRSILYRVLHTLPSSLKAAKAYKYASTIPSIYHVDIQSSSFNCKTTSLDYKKPSQKRLCLINCPSMILPIKAMVTKAWEIIHNGKPPVCWCLWYAQFTLYASPASQRAYVPHLTVDEKGYKPAEYTAEQVDLSQ